MFIPFILLAQEDLPVTEDVQIEVLSGELKITSKAQNMRIQIICNSASPGQKYVLDLKEVKGLLVPINAVRDDEALWLINSADANINNVVLAWDTIDDTKLQLSPGNWATPFTLDLQIRLSFTNLIDVPNITETQLDVTVVDGGSENLAAPTGRGNQISLNNTRE
jgi:hypothetical protein